MSNPAESVAVVGAAGDLGSKLSARVVDNLDAVLAYDIVDGPDSPGVLWAPDLGTLLEDGAVDVVHWCAPIYESRDITRLGPNQLLVFHDSVMANSQRARLQTKNKPQVMGSVAVVHLLMNEENTVVVSTESDSKARVINHFETLGLIPKTMTPKEHDIMMSDTQAPLAILCRYLLPKLKGYADEGLLTPSGHSLKSALEDRSAKWTEATFRTILSNPELPAWLQDLLTELVLSQNSPKG